MITRIVRHALFTAAALALVVGASSQGGAATLGSAAAVTLPPVNAKFDYQIGGDYPPLRAGRPAVAVPAGDHVGEHERDQHDRRVVLLRRAHGRQRVR